MTVNVNKNQFDAVFLNNGGSLNRTLNQGKLLTTSLGTKSKGLFSRFDKNINQNHVSAAISAYVQDHLNNYNDAEKATIRANLKTLQEKFSSIRHTPDAYKEAAHATFLTGPETKQKVSYRQINQAIQFLTPAVPSLPVGQKQTQHTASHAGSSTLVAPAQPKADRRKKQTQRTSSPIALSTPAQPKHEQTPSTAATAPKSATFQRPSQVTGDISSANDALVQVTSTTTAGSSVKLRRLPDDHPVMQQIILHEKGYRLEGSKLVHHPELAVPDAERQGLHPSGTLIPVNGELHVQYIVMHPGPLGATGRVTVRKQDQVYATTGLKVDFGALIRQQHAKIVKK